MAYPAPKVITAFGVALLLASVFLLPWVRFADRAATGQAIPGGITDHRVQQLLEALRSVLRSPALQTLFALARDKGQLSGWDLWHYGVPMHGLLRTSLFLTMIVMGMSGLWTVSALLLPSAAWLRVGDLVCAIASGLVLVLLLSFVPTIDTFGLRADLGVVMVCFWTASQTGSGIFGALLGLAMIAFGGGLGYVVHSSGTIQQDRKGPTSRRLSSLRQPGRHWSVRSRGGRVS